MVDIKYVFEINRNIKYFADVCVLMSLFTCVDKFCFNTFAVRTFYPERLGKKLI